MSPKIIHEGNITIYFGTGALWKDFPIPSDTDTYASAFKYLERWMGWIKELWPTTNFALVVRFGDDDPPEINAADHSAGDEILADLARTGLELHNRPEVWLVKRHTDESKNYWERYPRKGSNGNYSTPENDPGSETEDPA